MDRGLDLTRASLHSSARRAARTLVPGASAAAGAARTWVCDAAAAARALGAAAGAPPWGTARPPGPPFPMLRPKSGRASSTGELARAGPGGGGASALGAAAAAFALSGRDASAFASAGLGDSVILAGSGAFFFASLTEMAMV